MNRLTRTAEKFDYCRDFCGNCKYPAEIREKCLDARLYERLRDYEDTGLEPEEVVQQSVKLKLIDFNQRIKSDRLAEIAKAEYEGRLLVLPCNLGTPIYWINCNPHDGAWIEESTFALCDIYAFGKTVFLTREEAEAALKEAKT